MLEVLKSIKEYQLEARKIIDDAYIEAEKIKKNLLQNSARANEEAYLAEIAENDRNAAKMQKKSISDIDQQIKEMLIDAEQQAKEIEKKSMTKQKIAVNAVLDMFFRGSV